MQMRVLAFLPAAIVATAAVMLATSLFVDVVEAGLPSRPTQDAGPYRVSRYESLCDGLFRELHELTHRATRCDDDPRCERSPLLCSGALDEEIDREYRSLQAELETSCGFSGDLLDYAWRSAPAGHTPDATGTSCGDAHDWLEAATVGEARPASYSF